MLAAQESFEGELRQGLLALNGNDLVQARQSLEKASRLKPDNPVVWAALAQTYLRANERQQAEEAAGRAADLASGNPVVEHALSTFYSETGDFAKAAAAERLYAASKPADSQAAAHAAALSLQAGEAHEAIQWTRAALQQTDTAELHHLLGQAYIAANQPEEGVPELRHAVERDPRAWTYVFDLGQVQMRRGDFTGALATLDQGRQRFPNNAQIQLAYGVAAYGQRRFADAIDAFLKVTRIDASVEQPYVFLSRILDQAGDRLPEVVAAFARWEQAEPRNNLAACLHAKALSAAAGDPAVIEAELRRSIQLDDSYWEAHFELGVQLLKKHEWKEAAAELSRSIALNPRVAAAHFQLARAYDRLGEPERAKAERSEHERLTAPETNTVPAAPAKEPTLP